MSANETKRWLNPDELFYELGISKSWQAKLRMQKKIPFSKIGNKFIRYDRLEINKWLENNKMDLL